MSRQVPFAAIAREKAEQRGRLLRTLAGMPDPQPEGEPAPAPSRPRSIGFDGGARMPVPQPKTDADIAREHGQVIVELAMAARLHSASGGLW